MKASTLLLAARGYIERGWTRGVLARDVLGNARFPESPDAVCWCATGALLRTAHVCVCESNAFEGALLMLRRAGVTVYAEVRVTRSNGAHVEFHNDEVVKTQEEALAWFDVAIKLAKESES